MDDFDDFKTPVDYALLSHQRMTSASLSVFDASQFKLAVDKNVPADVIEKLQKKFGDDLAGGKKWLNSPLTDFANVMP